MERQCNLFPGRDCGAEVSESACKRDRNLMPTIFTCSSSLFFVSTTHRANGEIKLLGEISRPSNRTWNILQTTLTDGVSKNRVCVRVCMFGDLNYFFFGKVGKMSTNTNTQSCGTKLPCVADWASLENELSGLETQRPCLLLSFLSSSVLLAF